MKTKDNGLMIFRDLHTAVEELKREPSHPVQVHIDGLDIEIRALAPKQRPVDLGAFLSDLGPWEGESLDELLARLRKARKSG
jgi:hypothetical protein